MREKEKPPHTLDLEHKQQDLATLTIGFQGEKLAEKFLIEKGHQILARNWRHKNHLEVDLITLSKENQLVAVEVKSHKTKQKTEPFENVNLSKISRLKRALEIYADLNLDYDLAMRIDVLSVVISPLKIEYFEAVDL